MHDQKNEALVLVVEITNAEFPDPSKREWSEPLITDRHAAWFLNDGAAGIMKHDLPSLISWASSCGYGENLRRFPGLRQLPFLLIEALLNHGFKIEPIEDYKISV